MKATIEVTQEDIDRGKKKDCKLCPVALALNRIRPFSRNIWQPSSTLLLGWNNLSMDDFIEIYPPPLIVHDFIEAFDAGDLVQPFTFELEWP